MRVEACCQRILNYVLPLVDEKRKGTCIDVGVGTFAFYCEMFAMLGFKTVAVEPLPVEGVRVLCQYDGITLIEACLSDVTGIQTIHLGNVAGGWDSNYASLEPDWFGVSTETREVQSLTLSKLLLNLNAQKVTCLKLDIEGAESTVITKFGELPKAWLPNVVMFEYGGGDYKEKGQYGWSPKFIKATMECFKSLKDCGYGFCIMIDNALNTEAKIFDLQSLILEPDSIFYQNGGYGNIIAFRNFNLPEEVLTKLCAPYYETSEHSQKLITDINIVISETEELEVCKFQLSQIQQELEQQKALFNQSQSQLQSTQGELEQSQSQLHQTQDILEQYQSQLHQTQEILEQYQSELYQQNWGLESYRFQLHQTKAELARSKSQLHRIKAELHQAQEDLEQLKAHFSVTQLELVRTKLQQQSVKNEPPLENNIRYKLLVWDAWYAYQKGDLQTMQEYLQDSLKLASVSLTESLVNWLESFSQFSAEKGQLFDTYELTNSQEWKRLMQRRIRVSNG